MIKVGFRAAMINSGSFPTNGGIPRAEKKIVLQGGLFFFKKNRKKIQLYSIHFFKVSSKSKIFKSLFLDRLKPKNDTFQVDIFWTLFDIGMK